jgi:serine O-acetyltransferase
LPILLRSIQRDVVELSLSDIYENVSAEVADWGRERKPFFAWDPGRSLLASIRTYQRFSGRWGPLAWLIRKAAVIRHNFWTIISGAEIPINCRIGGGLSIPHPNGIVIHPDVSVGPNCLIFQQVTLGSNRLGTPTIGGHVDIGAGAKVLGPISVGNHAVVGANAVVLTDVPAGETVVGVPAKIVSARS